MTKLTLEPPVYLIGEYYYSPTSGVVSKNQVLNRLRAKESALLNSLIDHFPNILSREQIVKELYENTYATDATINQLVKRLRKAMNDDLRSLIRTIPKQGYMLTAAPQLVEVQPTPQSIAPKYIGIEHGLLEPINVNIEELNRVNAAISGSENEQRLRLFGAVSVIGGFVALLLGYSLGYTMTPSPHYLTRVTPLEAEQLSVDELTLSPAVIIDNNQQTLAIQLVSEGKVVNCLYQDQMTLCE